MSDLWTSASVDVEAEHLDRHITTARVASAAVWPFLAAATNEVDFANRKALVADRLDRIAAAAAEGDPALFGVVRASLEDGFDTDFAVMHGERVAAARIEATKTAERLAAEASIREAAEREVLTKVLAAGDPAVSEEENAKRREDNVKNEDAIRSTVSNPEDYLPKKDEKTAAGLDNLGDAKAEPFGAKGDDENDEKKVEDDTKTAARDTGTCGTCGRATSYDSSTRSWTHDNEGSDTQHKVTKASKTAAEYAGGSPKEGDTAKCHADGGAIQFFDGQWMHLKGTGGGHNDVYPNTPKEQADADAAKNASKTAASDGDTSTCKNCGKSIEYADTAWVHTPGDNIRCQADGDGNPVELKNTVAEPKTASKTAAFPPPKGGDSGNPFGQKKPANDGDAGAPDHNADQQGGSWQCPACGSANAYTQGGVDLDEALKAKQPIQCGDCKQVDSTGGSAGTADANGAPKQDHPSPGQPPAHASRHPFGVTASSGGHGGATITYLSSSHPMVTITTTAAPFNPIQPGVPDDMTDGPHVPDAAPIDPAPEALTTRPRQMPDQITPQAPGAAAPAAPAAPDPTTPETPKKAAGLGFASASFKTANDSAYQCPKCSSVGDRPGKCENCGTTVKKKES